MARIYPGVSALGCNMKISPQNDAAAFAFSHRVQYHGVEAGCQMNRPSGSQVTRLSGPRRGVITLSGVESSTGQIGSRCQLLTEIWGISS